MKPSLAIALAGLPALIFALLVGAVPALAQLPSTEERLKILTDPESVKNRLEKEKTRPPIEIFRSQVAPFDVLPYVKPNHWITLSAEARSNYDDFVGLIQSGSIPLLGMPHEVVFRRDARMPKEQISRLSLQAMLPRVPNKLDLELTHPDSVRSVELWRMDLHAIDPRQMLVLVLTKDAGNDYPRWNKFQALRPSSLDRVSAYEAEAKRYYRLVFPLDPEKPRLSPHPLTWTTISHVVWDGMPPDRLNVGQQQALVDWLHWGGQLIFMGGAGASFDLLHDSFLQPFLPAEPTGESSLLESTALDALSASYPPPIVPREDEKGEFPQKFLQFAGRYAAKAPIKAGPKRPLFLAHLRPLRTTATPIPLGEGSPHLLGIEARIGRGRVLMLTVSPTDPALAAWPGLDTLVRRVVLRRPEERKVADPAPDRSGNLRPAQYAALTGPELSWFRYLSRDLGADPQRPAPYEASPQKSEPTEDSSAPVSPAYKALQEEDEAEANAGPPVAEWLDSSGLPILCRRMLEEASGIKIPSASFVLKVILAYIIAVVPLNWLVCRYLLRRREWAWIVVPVLSLGFAVGVERAAAYDVGYEAACDEIDVVEMYAGYPRVHLSRFASLYSTGRVRFTISYPDDPTALALPMDTGHFIQGEDVSSSIFRSQPVPALEGFQVQPRSLGMYRSEQMTNFSGSITLETEGGPRRIANSTDLVLHDAVVVDVGGSKGGRETYLGTIGPGATIEVKPAASDSTAADQPAGFEPSPLLAQLRNYREERPENSGEIRLVAWAKGATGGQKFDPAVDRHRGLTAVVVHLRNGPSPPSDGLAFNALAARKGTADPADGPPHPVVSRGNASSVFNPNLQRANPRSRGRGNRIPLKPLGVQAPAVRQKTERP